MNKPFIEGFKLVIIVAITQFLTLVITGIIEVTTNILNNSFISYSVKNLLPIIVVYYYFIKNNNFKYKGYVNCITKKTYFILSIIIIGLFLLNSLVLNFTKVLIINNLPLIGNYLSNENVNVSYNIGILIGQVIIFPFFEEIVYRGILLKELTKKYKPWIALIISSLLFSFSHLSSLMIPYTFVLGLLLGWIYIKTKSLLAIIFSHLFYNIIGQVAINYSPLIFNLSTRPNFLSRKIVLIGFSLLFIGIIFLKKSFNRI